VNKKLISTTIPILVFLGCTVNVENVNLLDIIGGIILIAIVSVLVYIGLSKIFPGLSASKKPDARPPVAFRPPASPSTQRTVVPPRSTSKIWVYKNKKQWGPYTPERIKEMMRTGRIQPNDPIWCQGCPEWIPLSALRL
jgi:hypothetical protein